jgi:hypothetical protein
MTAIVHFSSIYKIKQAAVEGKKNRKNIAKNVYYELTIH